MELKKHWWGKSTHRKFHSEQHGWCEEVKCYLFGRRGLCFWTLVNYLPRIQEHSVKRGDRADIEEMTGYCEWRERMKLMRLNNEEFDLILNNR